MKKSVGEYTRKSVHEYHIPAFGRVRIDAGSETVGLFYCTGPYVQMISDGKAFFVPQGATVPLRGNIRYVRNPFASPITVHILYGAPIQNAPAPSVDDVAFNSNVGSLFYEGDGSPGVGIKRGCIIMSEHSRFHLKVEGRVGQEYAIIPKASLDYLASKPVGVLEDKQAVYRLDGSEMDDVHAYAGTYTDADMAAWIAAAEWHAQLTRLNYRLENLELEVTPDQAVIAYILEDTLRLNIRLFDRGSLSPERFV